MQEPIPAYYPGAQSTSSGTPVDLDAVLQTAQVGLTVFEAVRDEEGILKDLRVALRNELALEFSRIPAEKYVVGALLGQLMPKELNESFERLLEVVRTGKPLMSELYQPHLDKWIAIRVNKYGDGLLSAIQDISEQKRQQEKLMLSARTLEGILQASPHAVLVFEAIRDERGMVKDFRIIRYNQRAVAATGMTAEALGTTTLFSCMPSVRERLPQYLAVMETGEQETYEFFNEKLGLWRRITNTPLGDGFVMTMENITEQKEQSRIIEEQAQLFQGVLRSLQNGLTIYRIIRNDGGELEDLEYLEVADSVLRDTGKTREEILGCRLRTLYPGIETTDYWAAYIKVAHTGEHASFETHFTLPGYDNFLMNWVTPLGSDKLVNVYYIVNDLKQVQRQLEYTVHELSRSNEDLEQFASIASHDLQEPLRKVQSFGAMLEHRFGEVLGESGRDLLGRMTSAAGRMRNLVTGLLAFARLSGDENVPLRPVDLNTLMVEIISDVDQMAADGTITIANRLPFTLGIESQLRHLFQNLLTNALKFRKPDVAPLVTITSGPLLGGDSKRLAPLVNPADYLRIEVRDNGIGFEPDYSEKIFGLFERLHGLNEYQGTGLGLSISRRVAERHEGVIWAEGRPGEGATFIILLQKAA